MNTLTKQQLNRQDFVDNQIFETINSLLPPSQQIEWDIEIIGNIRKLIYEEVKKKLGDANEKQFYPFVEL